MDSSNRPSLQVKKDCPSLSLRVAVACKCSSSDGSDSEKVSLLKQQRSFIEAPSSQRALSNCQRLAYGVGHVFNDLVAAMWFSYLLIYLIEVEHFRNVPAGNLMLIGQVADAICTPIVGIESDRINRGFCNLGKRKTWHVIGTICTLLTFPFIFEPCINCSEDSGNLQMLYYAPFIVIFQFGWAAVQVSHLSYSSEITTHEHERVILQSIRNFFTVFANTAVFGMFTFLFLIGSDDATKKVSPTVTGLDSSDVPKFRYMTIFCVGVGIIFIVIFHSGTSCVPDKSEQQGESQTNVVENGQANDVENGQTKVVENGQAKIVENGHTNVVENGHTNVVENGQAKIVENSPSPRSRLGSVGEPVVYKCRTNMRWIDWLKEHQFYQIGLLYMFTRLYYNISQVYFGIYLTKTVKMDKMYVAVMPLFVYGSSFLASALAPTLNKAVGRKFSYFLGTLFGIGGNTWVYFMADGSDQVYGAATCLGIANSVLLITSLSMTSDLIADNAESGAFVYGAMSFADKLSNGLTIFLIQKFDSCSSQDCAASSVYYRHVESLVPGGANLAALVVLLTLVPQVIGVRRKNFKRPKTKPFIGNENYQVSIER